MRIGIRIGISIGISVGIGVKKYVCENCAHSFCVALFFCSPSLSASTLLAVSFTSASCASVALSFCCILKSVLASLGSTSALACNSRSKTRINFFDMEEKWGRHIWV